MSKELDIKAAEHAQEMLEVFLKTWNVEIDDNILLGMFEKTYMVGAAYKPKKNDNPKQKKWRFGNLILFHEETNVLDYYKLTDLVNDWSIRFRQDTPLYRWIGMLINDVSKHEYLNRLFMLYFALTHSWKATPIGEIEMAKAFRDDCLRIQEPYNPEEDKKIIEQLNKDYDFEHTIHEPKENKDKEDKKNV